MKNNNLSAQKIANEIINELEDFTSSTYGVRGVGIIERWMDSKTMCDFISDIQGVISKDVIDYDDIYSTLDSVICVFDANGLLNDRNEFPYGHEETIFNLVVDVYTKNGMNYDGERLRVDDFDLSPLCDTSNIKNDFLFKEFQQEIRPLIQNQETQKLKQIFTSLIEFNKHSIGSLTHDWASKCQLIDDTAKELNKTEYVHSVWKECFNDIYFKESHTKEDKQVEVPKNYLSEAMTDAIKALKEKGLSLPEIGKAFNEVSKEVLVQLGKENLANKGR